MENPFESGHIKNYIFLYSSVVVIMVLFFIASSLFNNVKEEPKKVFKRGAVKSLQNKPRNQSEKIVKKDKTKKSVARFITIPSN